MTDMFVANLGYKSDVVINVIMAVAVLMWSDRKLILAFLHVVAEI